MNEFDDLAELYDATRGGEQRGDEYADEVSRPAIEALRALPESDMLRRATVEAVVLERG